MRRVFHKLFRFSKAIQELKGLDKQMEKYCKLTNLPEPRKKLVAFQASKGAVSDYIQRYMDAFPQNTWNDIRG